MTPFAARVPFRICCRKYPGPRRSADADFAPLNLPRVSNLQDSGSARTLRGCGAVLDKHVLFLVIIYKPMSYVNIPDKFASVCLRKALCESKLKKTVSLFPAVHSSAYMIPGAQRGISALGNSISALPGALRGSFAPGKWIIVMPGA